MSNSDENWQKRFRQHRMLQDCGDASSGSRNKSSIQKIFSNFAYHPYTELGTFILIILSLILLLVEVSIPKDPTGSWMGVLAEGGTYYKEFIYADLILTVLFALEYIIKLWVANSRLHFFRSTWIDLLAILPLFRVFRLVRTLRFLKMIRLIRTMKMEAVLDNQIVKDKTSFSMQGESLVVLSYLIFSVIFGAVGILVFEREHNDGFVDLGDGLWWCLVTITTVGYGDISPVTFGGQVVAVVIMFIGLSFYALLTGMISTVLIDRAQRHGEKTMEIKILENHIIICGWNNQAKNVIDNLLNTTRRHILVISPERPDLPKNPRVYSLTRDPSNRDSLLEGRIKQAFSAIILSNPERSSNPQDIDARSILIALAVEICNPKVHSVVELQNPDNIHHAKNAGVDEIIISSTYQGSILAQSASSPGVSRVFSDIFGITNTIVKQEPPLSEWIGKSYAEVSSIYINGNLGSTLGIIRTNEPILAPAGTDKILEGDLLVVLTKTE
jgi:voltage-gated potassium channel